MATVVVRHGSRPAPARGATAPTRPLVLLAAAVAAGLLAAAVSWLGSAEPASSRVPGGFSGSVVPERPMEYVRTPASQNRLVRVPCAGTARAVSSCWVSAGLDGRR